MMNKNKVLLLISEEQPAIPYYSYGPVEGRLIWAEAQRDADWERVKGLVEALKKIASGHYTQSGDLQGGTYEELGHVKIARVALAQLEVKP